MAYAKEDQEPATPQQGPPRTPPQPPPRGSSPQRGVVRRVDNVTLKVNLLAITVNGALATVCVKDDHRYVAMDSRLLRVALGVSSTPDPCILLDIREFILNQRGRRNRTVGVRVDKAGMPLPSSLTFDARGTAIKVLPKAWPVYVDADDFEYLLNLVKDDAEVQPWK